MSNSIYNSSGLGVDSLIQPGIYISNTQGFNNQVSLTDPSAVSFSNYYSGFPTGISTNYNWENPSTLGYQISGVDIANSVKAVYTNYSGANGTSYTFTPPSWCNTLKIIAIAGGGGGGSGGANTSNNRAGSGGSGAGGAQAIIVSNISSPQSNFSYNITFSGSGTGGAYQGTSGDSGHWGSQGISIGIGVASSNTALTGSVFIYGGGGGGPGPGTSNSNNNSVGGQNTVISSGNNTTSPIINGLQNYNNFLTVTPNSGNSGGGGGNSYIGTAGTITNFTGTNPPPPLNTNGNFTNVQNNNTGINNTNQIPGYGQGGVGGWNSNNNNGYQGQNGGPALVRVYYMA
jgi:hypothetical protein